MEVVSQVVGAEGLSHIPSDLLIAISTERENSYMRGNLDSPFRGNDDYFQGMPVAIVDRPGSTAGYSIDGREERQ